MQHIRGPIQKKKAVWRTSVGIVLSGVLFLESLPAEEAAFPGPGGTSGVDGVAACPLGLG